jgi:hypothetical protein
MARKTLTRILESALLTGVGQAGSYKPDDVLHWIEERLTRDEAATARAFLKYISDKGLHFGHRSIGDRFREFNDAANRSPMTRPV